jgi:Flp pilus assembly CpaE family ATPase
MLDALLLVEDPSASVALEQMAVESRQVQVLRSCSRLPSRYELLRMLNSLGPDLVFLELNDAAAATPLLDILLSEHPNIAVVGVADSTLPFTPRAVLQIGIAALLSTPITLREFQHAVATAVQRTNQEQIPHLFCFLPAKAGCGASTAAVNISKHAADILSLRTLLIEADLHSGVAGEYLRIQPVIPIREVLAEAPQLNSTRWRAVTVSAGRLDALLTDRSRKAPIPSWIDYFHLLRFVRTRYELIVVDLPEIVNEATAELVRRAAQVYVVTTPEVAPLKLAEQRMQELACRGVRDAQIEIVVNRWHRSDLDPDEIHKLLRCRVAAVLQNNYPVVRRCQARGVAIPESNKLGAAILDFTRKLSGREPPETERPGLLRHLLLGR